MSDVRENHLCSVQNREVWTENYRYNLAFTEFSGSVSMTIAQVHFNPQYLNLIVTARIT